MKTTFKHFVLAEANVFENRFLHEENGLQANQFENGQEGDDHRLSRGTGLEELNEAEAVGGGHQLFAQQIHHLRHADRLVAKLDARDFLAPLEDLLENAHQIHERDDQLGFRAFALVEAEVGLRPYVLLYLLLLVEELRSALEFFVFDEAMHEFRARIFLALGAGERIGWQEHLRLDVNQRRGHVNEIGGDVHVELFELVKIIEILARDLRDGNVVNVDFLLLDEIEQEIERAFVMFEMESVGRCHVFSQRFPLQRCRPKGRRYIQTLPRGNDSSVFVYRRASAWHLAPVFSTAPCRPEGRRYILLLLNLPRSHPSVA